MYEMSGANRTRLLLAAAVAAVAVAMWAAASMQRATADRLLDESDAAADMESAMLDQAAGLSSFFLTRDRTALQPFIDGVRDFNIAAARARSLATEPAQDALVARMTRLGGRWRELAETELGRLAVRPNAPSRAAEVRERRLLLDRFRSSSDRLQHLLAHERDERLDSAGLVSVGAIVALALILLSFGLYAIEREVRRLRARRASEHRYRDTQAEFAETMQVMRDEAEAHQLVKAHLERTIGDAAVTVLNRNNSDDRLYATTELEDRALADKLIDAEPESCLAIRLGQAYERGEGHDPLLACELCGRSAGEVLCTPSLVGGEVIGSVLVRNGRPFDDEERHRVAESVSQAAPVLANLRNLAIAEARAATDALTGLPNSRSCRDNLKRMVAHAGRAVSPLSVVMADLDHFKQVNDRFGHGAGDDVLAAVGEALRATLRGSDFGGRYGGEEFLVLLPGTDQHGAVEVAEKLRAAIQALEFQQPELTVTASLGVATYPLDALDADGVVRMADRALYAAKSQGRNRVAVVDAGRHEHDSHLSESS